MQRYMKVTSMPVLDFHSMTGFIIPSYHTNMDQSVVNDSAGVIISDTSIDIATVITDIEACLLYTSRCV